MLRNSNTSPGLQFVHGEWVTSDRWGQGRGAAGEMLQRSLNYFSCRCCLDWLSSGTKGGRDSDWICTPICSARAFFGAGSEREFVLAEWAPVLLTPA